MSKKTEKKSSRRRFRWVYIVIVAIFLYVVVQSFFLAQTSKMNYVVAQSGDLEEVASFTGVITREEQLIRASQSGVVEYYYPGNRHLSEGTMICSLRNNYYGDLLEQKMDDLYEQLLNEAAASEYAEDFQQLDTQIGEQIAAYVRGKTANHYDALYSMKNNVQTTMDQRQNLLAILQNEKINAMLEEQGIYEEQLNEQSANITIPEAGMISYTYDNYEGWTWEQVTQDFISNYQNEYEAITLNLQTIEEGDPLYRLVTGQDWQITFFVDAAQAEYFEEGSDCHFYIEGNSLTGEVLAKEQQGEQYKIVLEISEYLSRYANQRLAHLEFRFSGEEGIQVPKECILQQSYYRVPEDYVYDSLGQDCLMIRQEEGDVLFPIDVVYTRAGEENETGYVYFEMPEGLTEGALMIQSGTDQVMSLGEQETLSYVYTVNGGYQQLQIVEILYETDRYAIVEGVKLYDQILIP